MKKNKNTHLSISELAEEFQISQSSIELFSVHGLLTPISKNSTRSAYCQFDRVRLQFITRAKNADYSLGNIKELIGRLDPKQSEEDQIDAGLVHTKKKYGELQDRLENEDALEKINISCDIGLLETYINDLNKLKYNLPDIDLVNITISADEYESSPHNSELGQFETTQFNKASSIRKLLIIVAGIIVIVSGYIYINVFNILDRSEIQAMDDVDPNPSDSNLNDAHHKNANQPGEANDLDAAELDQSSDVDSEPKRIFLANSSVLQTEKEAQNPELDRLTGETAIDEQVDSTSITSNLLDALKESEQKEQILIQSENKKNENEFFKQLVSDLQKKYDEQSQIPTVKPDSKKKEPPAHQNDVQTTQKKKTPVKSTKTTPLPKSVALVQPKVQPTVDISESSTTDSSTKLASNRSRETSPVQTQISALNLKTIEAEKKLATVTDVKSEKNAGNPAPPKKAINPEALKWVQKSYESVLSGNASEAIVTASVAITLDPDSVNAYINRSWAYSKKGLFDKAIQDCNKALGIDINNALAYNNRGLAFQGKGDLDKAKSDYQQACRLGFSIGCKNYEEVVGSLAAKK